MRDQRLDKLAATLVGQSLQVTAGEKIALRLVGIEGIELARACGEEIVRAGGLWSVRLSDEQMEEFFLSQANEQQLTSKPDLAEYEASYFDKHLTIIAESNVNNLTNIESEKLLLRSRLSKKTREIIMSKPWVLTYYPTPAIAQAAGMSLRDLENYIFASCNQDWAKMGKKMAALAERLTNQDLEIIGKWTKLHLSTKGMNWVSDDYRSNMPGGEIFTSPVVESVEGVIYFDFPVSRHGKTIKGIELTFEKGVVVKAVSETNQDYLEALLATDAGAKRVGEIALGLNPGCDRYLDNVLFDEKMAGTIHLALGAGFPECGAGVNQSALHLDIVKEMRGKDCLLKAGGKVIMRAGKIVK